MVQLLSEVVRATSLAADSAALLTRVAQLLTAHADWVLADVVEEPDLVARVAACTPEGPMQLPEGMGPTSSRRSSATSVGLLPRLKTSPQRVLRLDEGALRTLAEQGDARTALQARTALATGARQLLVLGLVGRDTLLGVLTLGSAEPLADALVEQLRDVALHVGQALDAAKLLASQSAVAAAMQHSLLPPLPAVPGLRLAARYDPAAREIEVGGDWYDAFVTPHDLVLVVGDASGHDLAAAARMADLRNLLRAHAVTGRESPAALLGQLERTTDILRLDAQSTVIVGRLQGTVGGSWELIWCSAGHPPPVLLHEGRAELLEPPPDLMLGVQAGMQRHDHHLTLVPGDVLVLYTDGLVERRGQSLGESTELLRSTVQELAGSQPDPLAEQLLTRFASEAADDVALLVLEVLHA